MAAMAFTQSADINSLSCCPVRCVRDSDFLSLRLLEIPFTRDEKKLGSAGEVSGSRRRWVLRFPVMHYTGMAAAGFTLPGMPGTIWYHASAFPHWVHGRNYRPSL